MNTDRMEAAFAGLRDNVPRAPAELVERMVRTVNAMEHERARRAGIKMNAPKAGMDREKNIRPPEIKRPKGPSM